MNKKSDYYLFLFCQIKNLGPKTIYFYLQKFKTAEKFYLAIKNQDPSVDKKTFTIAQAQLANPLFITQTKITWENINSHYLTILDTDYPRLLKNIYDPPLFLFYQGNIKLLNSPYVVSIVGSRTISTYHQSLVAKIINQLAGTNLILVSGLALGIDSQVHQHALINNLATIAVLGSGFDPSVLYPASNLKLAQQIIKSNGLLISEYSPTTPPAIHQFPKRNRILAGLSPLTIVISGAKKSGTLITAQLALDAGREVYAVPGNINQILCQGPNQLIASGARPLLEAQDILNFYQLNHSLKSNHLTLKPLENKLLNLLAIENISLETAAHKLAMPMAELQSLVSNLEILGLLKVNIFNELELT